MEREQVLQILHQHRTEINAYGVKSLALFGSVARGEAQRGSDVDLLVEFDHPVGLFGLIALQLRLEEILGCPVDIGTADSLKASIRPRVMEECVYVPWALGRPHQDILDAIAEIQAFVSHTRFEEFQNDLKTMRAVELDLIIMGEAANTIPQDVQEAHPEIAWPVMRGIRNRLVHTYFSVSPQILWDTIHQDLPPLAESLKKIDPKRQG